MNTKKHGDKAYIQFVASCVMKDWVVLEPLGDKDRYDLVIDRGNGFETVQAKSARIRSGAVNFKSCSCGYTTKNGKKSRFYSRGYKGEVDWFGVYCFDNQKCYLVPVDDVPATEVNLRVEAPRNGQKKGIKFAKDYEIGV